MGEPLRRLCVWVTLHDTLVQYAACLAPLAFGLGERYHSIPIILTRTTLHFSFFQVSLLFLPSWCFGPFVVGGEGDRKERLFLIRILLICDPGWVTRMSLYLDDGGVWQRDCCPDVWT